MMSVHRFLHWYVHELGWVHWGYSCASVSRLVMIYLDCRKQTGGKLSSTGDFRREKM